LAQRLDELEHKTEALAMSHDTFSRNTRNQLKQVFDALRELMTPPEPPKRPFGLVTQEDKGKKGPGLGKKQNLARSSQCRELLPHRAIVLAPNYCPERIEPAPFACLAALHVRPFDDDMPALGNHNGSVLHQASSAHTRLPPREELQMGAGRALNVAIG
jgi:hypothetical protein